MISGLTLKLMTETLILWLKHSNDFNFWFNNQDPQPKYCEIWVTECDTEYPSASPSALPSESPSESPSALPSESPSESPTLIQTTTTKVHYDYQICECCDYVTYPKADIIPVKTSEFLARDLRRVDYILETPKPIYLHITLMKTITLCVLLTMSLIGIPKQNSMRLNFQRELYFANMTMITNNHAQRHQH